MKRLIPIFIFSFNFVIHAEICVLENEVKRTWTNQTGDNVNGILMALNLSTDKIKIKCFGQTNSVFWYPISKLSTLDRYYVNSRNIIEIKNKLPKNLYSEYYYNNTPNRNWKFFDTKFCDVKIVVDYDKLKEVPSYHNYDHITGNLRSCTLYLWDNPSYNKKISLMIDEFNFRPTGDKLQTSNKNYTDGILANVEVLHYLGVSIDDFKKLRWFFSAEDFAFYPEKIYRFLGVLDKVSKKFDQTEWFEKRHSKGIPIIMYWKHNGVLKSRWANFYVPPKFPSQYNNMYKKIIYLKTH
jgi:hypothetical protein